MTLRFADDSRDTPAPALGWAARGVRASAAACALLLATACASTPEAEEPDAPPETRLVSGREIAHELGLSVRPVDDAGRRILSRGAARIVFYDGSPLISVRGQTLHARAPIEFVDGDAWVDMETAGRIDTAWASVRPSGPTYAPAPLPPSLNAGLPPPPTRPVSRPPVPTADPVDDAPPPGGVVSNRPSAAELRAWGVPLRRSWQYLVMHHSATASGSAASFDVAHKKKGWNGLGYDFVIGNGNGSPDGLVEVGYRWKEQSDGAHAGDKLMNQRGIGICLVGDFTRSRPTPRQLRSLERLTTFLARYCSIPPQNVRLHRDFRETECPGTYFPREFVAHALDAPRSRKHADLAHDAHDPSACTGR